MKLDRLLEITILLINRGSATAPELAERFGVSTRTIYRDIDVLSSAGVPVYTSRGAGGGISLLGEFTLPKAIVSKEERESILFSLQTLRATRYPEIESVLEKLSGLFQTAATDWISIDFSPWESGPAAQGRIRELRDAILHGKVLRMEYWSADNRRSLRDVEPIQLSYKAHSWYLKAWCRRRHALRTFRLSRIRSLTATGETFDPNVKRPPAPPEYAAPPKQLVHVVLRCRQPMAYRLFDDYDDDVVTDNGDGTYTLEIDFPEDEWVYGYILGFGDYAEVLSPPALRELIRDRIRRMQKIYESRET